MYSLTPGRPGRFLALEQFDDDVKHVRVFLHSVRHVEWMDKVNASEVLCETIDEMEP